MAKRRLRFYCGFVAHHYVRDLPGVLLQMPALRLCPSEVRCGIRIIDTMPHTRVRFLRTVGEALDLITAYDPVRIGRIRTQVRTIANVAGIIGSDYQPAFKLCVVNLRCFDCQPDTQSAVKLLASTLVHDATFGYLLSQGSLCTRRNRQRFDGLCCKAAQRFLQRLGMTTTPWDREQVQHIALGERLTIWLKDTVAAEREAAKNLHDRTGPT